MRNPCLLQLPNCSILDRPSPIGTMGGGLRLEYSDKRAVKVLRWTT
jgi:hypothetical protein